MYIIRSITFWWLCKCDILVDLTSKQIHLPAILVSKVSVRSRLLDTCGGGAWYLILNTVQILYHSLHSPVLTSMVICTEQQAVARNPAPLTPSSSYRWSLTVMVLVVVRGAGVEVPQ